MDRRYLGAYIAAQFAAILTATKQTAQDTLQGYGPALDMVMRQLGTDTQDVSSNPAVPAGLERDAVLLTDYYALEWLLRGLAVQVTNSQANFKTFADQMFTQTKQLFDQAYKRVPQRYDIEGGDFSLGRLQIDIFEPIQGAGYGPWRWWG